MERMLSSLSQNTSYLQNFYAIPPFNDGSCVCVDLMYSARVFGVCGRSRGKLKKGGVPDMRSAACVVINDFNQGMIPFYVKPPRRMVEQR